MSTRRPAHSAVLSACCGLRRVTYAAVGQRCTAFSPARLFCLGNFLPVRSAPIRVTAHRMARTPFAILIAMLRLQKGGQATQRAPTLAARLLLTFLTARNRGSSAGGALKNSRSAEIRVVSAARARRGSAAVAPSSPQPFSPGGFMHLKLAKSIQPPSAVNTCAKCFNLCKPPPGLGQIKVPGPPPHTHACAHTHTQPKSPP